MSELIDTTEMYLRTIYELEEEGVPPLRARIAERLAQSGPTVSQTVGRMERDGLLSVQGDRQIELSTLGRERAARVMRKHRLAERLLTDVIGLGLSEVHTEACRWEHVISESVEKRLVEVLGHPVYSPYGNPIPALAELGATAAEPGPWAPLADVLPADGGVILVKVGMLTESAQADEELMALLACSGVVPGATIGAALEGDRLVLSSADSDGDACKTEAEAAHHIFVTTD